MKQILFICTKNACRSQLAEALVNHDMPDRFTAVSAGIDPTRPHPLALEVLAEIGIDHSRSVSKPIDDFKDWKFDYVISICDNADKHCPVLFGDTRRVHFSMENPDAAPGSKEERLAAFRRVRDRIRKQMTEYLSSGS